MLLSFSMDYCWDYKIKITEESKKTPEKQTPRLDNILVKITMYIYVVVMSKDHRYVQTFRTKQEAQNCVDWYKLLDFEMDILLGFINEIQKYSQGLIDI